MCLNFSTILYWFFTYEYSWNILQFGIFKYCTEIFRVNFNIADFVSIAKIVRNLITSVVTVVNDDKVIILNTIS